MTSPADPAQHPRAFVERRVATLLAVGAIVAVALLVVGVLLMLAAGISPDAVDYPGWDPAAVFEDLVALRPEGFLWLGLLVVIATPIVRVIGEAVGFAVARDRWMTAVALAILMVIVASVVIALAIDG